MLPWRPARRDWNEDGGLAGVEPSRERYMMKSCSAITRKRCEDPVACRHFLCNELY